MTKCNQMESKIKVYNNVSFLEYSPDDTTIAHTDMHESTVYFRNVKTMHDIDKIKVGVSLSCISWSPNSKNIAIGSYCMLTIYNIKNKTTKSIENIYLPYIDEIIWNPSGTRLIIRSHDKLIALIDANRLIQIFLCKKFNSREYCPAGRARWVENGAKIVVKDNVDDVFWVYDDPVIKLRDKVIPVLNKYMILDLYKIVCEMLIGVDVILG